MRKSIIKIRDMSFKYGNKVVFDNLDFDIYEGEFTVIAGKSCSGKSTFAKILSGYYRADGYVNVYGYLLNDYFLYKILRNFSVCMDNNLFDYVRSCLAFPLEGLQYSKNEIDVVVDRISKEFKLEKILDKSFDEITLSERSRVFIASSLIYNPKIILIDDDVFMNLSFDDREFIVKILKEYQKKGLTIILLTKNLEDTLLGDRVIVFNDGKVFAEGKLKDIYKDDALEEIGFELPFIVKLSHNLMLYDLLDKTYFTEKGVMDKLWL